MAKYHKCIDTLKIVVLALLDVSTFLSNARPSGSSNISLPTEEGHPLIASIDCKVAETLQLVRQSTTAPATLGLEPPEYASAHVLFSRPGQPLQEKSALPPLPPLLTTLLQFELLRRAQRRRVRLIRRRFVDVLRVLVRAAHRR
jgi:hypothetical protein